MSEKIKHKLINSMIAVSVISILSGCGFYLAELSNYPFYYVEKPCVSDKVVVKSAGYTMNPVGSEVGCLAGLGRQIHSQADQKCGIFTKTQDVEARCKAYRGNWNSSVNVEFTYSMAHTISYVKSCKIKNPVTFTCN